MIQAIAFDWGGVFTEGTFDSGAIQDLAALAGVPEERVAETYLPLMAEFETGAFDLDGFHARFVEHSGLELEPEAFRETFLGAVRERKAMFAVLGAIPDGFRVAMLSNNVPVLCDRVRNDPRMERVERFVFSNEIGVRKPDPRAFAALSDAVGAPPDGTVFVDDSPANVEACRGLGFHGLLLDDFDRFLEAWREVLPTVPTGLEPASSGAGTSADEGA